MGIMLATFTQMDWHGGVICNILTKKKKKEIYDVEKND